MAGAQPSSYHRSRPPARRLGCSVGGRAAGEVDLAALVQASLVQLFGSIGGAIPLEFESITSGSGAEGVVTVDKR